MQNELINATMAKSPILAKADTIVNDALRKGAYLAEMITKNVPAERGDAFAYKALDTMSDLGGMKLQLSEDAKIEALKKIDRIRQGKYKTNLTQAFSSGDWGSKYKLADPQGAYLGNYTLQLALMYIIEFGSNLDQVKFGLRKYFPDMPVSALQTQIDRGAAVYGRLNGSDYNTLPIRDPMNSYGYLYEAARYAEQVLIMPRDMLFTREKGTNNMSSGPGGLEQRLAYETLYGMVRIETSKNLDLADAVLRNGFYYPVGSTNAISSGQPSQNRFVFPSSIGTYNSSTGIMTPNNSLDIMQVLGAMISGWLPLVTANRYVREIMLHPLVYTAITQNVYFQQWLRQKFITSSDIDMRDEILRFFTIPGFENIKFVCSDISWNPAKTNEFTNSFAMNQYVMGGSNTTLTNASFYGFVGIDASSQGGTLGGVLIAPDVLEGGYMSGASGYGVQVFDMTAIEPANPHIKVVPFATYIPAPFFKEAIFTIDFQVQVV